MDVVNKVLQNIYINSLTTNQIQNILAINDLNSITDLFKLSNQISNRFILILLKKILVEEKENVESEVNEQKTEFKTIEDSIKEFKKKQFQKQGKKKMFEELMMDIKNT